MINSSHENFVTSPVFTTHTVLLTPGGTQSAVGAATFLPAPVTVQNQPVALPLGPPVSLTAAGEGAYGAAVWPVASGSKNTMSFTSSLPGPGAALASFTLATPALDFTSSFPIIDAAGNVYIISRVGSTVVLRKYATTSVPFVELWSFTTTTIDFVGDNNDYSNYCPTLGEGVVYFMTTNGLYCIDSNTGTQKWLNPLRSFNYEFRALLMLDNDGNVYGAVRELVFCVAASGVTKWMSTVIQYVVSMALDAATGILYAWCFGLDSNGEGNNSALRLFDHVTGVEIVSTPNTILCPMANSIQNLREFVVIGNEFVYVTQGFDVVAFRKNGEVAWVTSNYTRRNYETMIYNPRLDRVYVTSMDSVSGALTRLAALDGATGELLNVTTSGPPLITNCIIDGNDLIYASAADETIRVLDANLNELASVPVPASPGWFHYVSFAFNTNAKLYLTTSAGLFVSN